MMETRVSGFTKYPLCPFCSAPWTDDMVDLEVDASSWPSGSMDVHATIEIKCAGCKKLIYWKNAPA